jgi:hypothetical protein
VGEWEVWEVWDGGTKKNQPCPYKGEEPVSREDL